MSVGNDDALPFAFCQLPPKYLIQFEIIFLELESCFVPVRVFNFSLYSPIYVFYFLIVSGDVPKEPVVSKNNGLLFEKRLIEKVIKETGKCPVTGSDLNEEDLIPVRGKFDLFSVYKACSKLSSTNSQLQK